jgi:IS5 family transposase
MYQTQKGKEWLFGLKVHIGVDARTGLTHSVSTTAANVHDITETANLLHGEACFVSKGVNADLLIGEIPSKIRILKKHPRKNKQSIRTEYIKASIRAKVEHPFRIIKCQFGFRNAIYRGLAKNDSKLAMLFALANVFRVDQMTRAERG